MQTGTTDLERTYASMTPASRRAMGRASEVMPGGNTRTTAHYSPYPVVIARGEGPFLWDADGNRYIDLLYNYTSLVHGHAFPPVVDVVRRVAAHGTAWPAAHPAQIELAELLCDRIGSVERVRFCNSGTEAGLVAATLAREVTGRPLIAMAHYGYHGSYDDLVDRERKGGSDRTLFGTYDDLSSFQRLMIERGDEVAAVFLEPVLGAGGIHEGSADFLRGVQDLCTRYGALFVLDEVITFRLAVGGAQTPLWLTPDLTMLGKIVGGGFPVGVVGGRAEVMDRFDPRLPEALSHHGTFNGNPITCAAGLVALKALGEPEIHHMASACARIATELEAAGAELGIDIAIRRTGSLMNVDFGDDGLMRSFHLACLTRGLFIAPRGMMVMATIMSEELVMEIVERLRLALQDIV